MKSRKKSATVPTEETKEVSVEKKFANRNNKHNYVRYNCFENEESICKVF